MPHLLVMRPRILSLVALGTLACAGEPGPPAEAAAIAPILSPLAGVVGHWTDTTDGGPVLMANGERWSGTTSRESMDSASRRLFNEVSESFLANTTSPTAFPFAVASDVLAFGSGTLRVQFNLVGGQSDQIAGIVFGLRPNGEYYYVRYNTKDGNLAVWRFRNGDREVLHHGDVHQQLPLGTWHELVVEVHGRDVRGYLAADSTLSVAHTLDADPAGRVGVWAKRDAITAFRGFEASPSR